MMLYQFGRSCACRGNPLWLPVLVIMLRGAHKGRPYVWATYKIDTGSRLIAVLTGIRLLC